MQQSFLSAVDDAQAPIRARWVVLLLLAYGVLWLLVHGTALVPPMDNIEQLIWVRKLAWAYYKHPPLTTVLIWPLVQLFGLHGWVTYVLGAGLTLLSLGMLWWLLRRMDGSRFALLALLAMLCITNIGGRLYFYNHNTTLLLFTVLSGVCAWLAFEQRSWRWWALLGLALGLGALAKYQIGLSVAALLVIWLAARGWEDSVHRPGLLLAGAIALLVFAPHGWWQWQHGSAALDYALSTSVAAGEAGLRGVGGSLLWLTEQLLTRGILSGLLLGLGVWFWRRRSLGQKMSTQPEPQVSQMPISPVFFLLTWGGLPLLLMTLMGLLLGSELQRHWGVAYLPAFMAGVMLLFRRVDWPAVLSRPVLWVFMLLQALLMLQVVLTSTYGLRSFHNRSWRNFDAARVAGAMAPQARQVLGGPVRVVIGDSKEAGALALNLPERPLVLLSNNYRWSPWVPADMVARCGAVEIQVEYRHAAKTGPANETGREAAKRWRQDASGGVPGASASAPVSSLATAPNSPATGGRMEGLGGGINAVSWIVHPPQPGQAACPAL